MTRAVEIITLACVVVASLIGCSSTTTVPVAPEADRYQSLGQNLLKNASFENQLIDWRVPAGASWSKDGGIDSSGALVIRATKPPDDEYIHRTNVDQCVRLPTGGSRYELSAQIRTETPPTQAYANRAEVVWYESLDCTRGGQWGAFIEPRSFEGWQSLNSHLLNPMLGARSARITVYQNGRHSNGTTAYWDDIAFWPTKIFEQSDAVETVPDRSVYTIAIGSNYVLNGGIDRDLDDWRTGSRVEWVASEGRAAPGAAKVTLVADSSGFGTGAFDQCFNFGDHGHFELGGSVKQDASSDQNGGGRLRITWFQNEDCAGPLRTDPRWLNPEDVDGWQDLHREDLAPRPNSRSALMEVIQSIRGTGRFSMFWDDLYFRPLD